MAVLVDVLILMVCQFLREQMVCRPPSTYMSHARNLCTCKVFTCPHRSGKIRVCITAAQMLVMVLTTSLVGAVTLWFFRRRVLVCLRPIFLSLAPRKDEFSTRARGTSQPTSLLLSLRPYLFCSLRELSWSQRSLAQGLPCISPRFILFSDSWCSFPV